MVELLHTAIKTGFQNPTCIIYSSTQLNYSFHHNNKNDIFKPLFKFAEHLDNFSAAFCC